MRRNHQDRIKNFPLFIENIVEISTFFCYYNRIAGSVSQTRRQNEGGRVMEIDIANNIKAVELLKVEILQNVTDLFGDLSAEAVSSQKSIFCAAVWGWTMMTSRMI